MWNPTRRSRKIGKTQGGRVKDGKAREKTSRLFTRDVWRKLSEEDGKWRVLRETPSGGTFHPCAGEDYLGVLARLPAQLTSSLKAIVLRRTPRREMEAGIEAGLRHRCVIMQSFPRSMEMLFGAPLGKATLRHYLPWCRNWSQPEGGLYVLRWSLEELRRYYLYHLFLHELGHLQQPAGRSRRRDESFAEDFALTWARKLGELTTSYDEALEQFLRGHEELDEDGMPVWKPES